ncbi:cell surface hyaluronidase [Lingula anatina]|uniref:Cell surface hyaluronidase n=1 Tax=Lingula anatina TaxID=7574 RepID=A0A1S3JN66_LINAN|nr:cell surface hyaluronidase [Lingula anatina]|eukprot:XP_013411812.1 cell surface hyaluronidase [Lingula anatina]
MVHGRLLMSMARRVFAVFLLLLLYCSGVNAVTCPWEREGLKPWSEAASWETNQVPRTGDVVEIVDDILLDYSPPKMSEVHIVNGARLIWDAQEGSRIELEAGRIHISYGGALEIGGSEPECRYPAFSKAIITLTGQRDEFPNEDDFGQKFLGVQEGGTLELHGADKIAWTKLAQTVEKLDDSSGLIFNHDESDNWDKRMPGLYVYVMNPRTGLPVRSKQFRYRNKRKMELELPAFLRNIRDGMVVMMASRRILFDVSLGFNLTSALEGLNDLGAEHVEEYNLGDAWCMIAVKGIPNISQEARSSVKGFLYTETWLVTLEHEGFYYQVQSGVALSHASPGAENYVRFRVLDRVVTPIITVIDDVTSWEAGDRIVVTSTDYAWTQAEERNLLRCDECNANQVKLDKELFYTHWGEVIENVDMRAEVLVLTRNVVVRGEVQDACYGDNLCDRFELDTWGGHIKMQDRFKACKIEGVELCHLGQQVYEGSYPIHFHMVKNVSDYASDTVIRQNSIHHSYSRCTTLHMTHGLKIYDNAAYLHIGHCYFLEDGGEKGIEFDGNIGLGTLSGTILPSDRIPSTFWITSPLSFLRNNVAAGSDGRGIMYVFPVEPRAESQAWGLLELGEAARTPIHQFENNVAHSNRRAGLWLDNILGQDGEVLRRGNSYKPQVQFPNGTVAPKEVILSRYTGYKNMVQNAWLRGSPVTMEKSSFSDSPLGVTFSIAGGHPQYVRDSVFVGQSENIGEPAVVLDRETRRYVYIPRSVPSPRIDRPVTGALFYDRPVYFENNWFGGYATDAYRPAGAIGFKRRDRGFSSSTNGVRGAMFGFTDGVDGNRMLDGDESVPGFGDEGGDKNKVMTDYDGSITGTAGAFVVKQRQFVNTQNCYNKTNWNLAVCPDRMAKIKIAERSQSDDDLIEDIYMVRDDFSGHLEYFDGNTNIGMLVINKYKYTLHFVGPSPDHVTFLLDGFEIGDKVRVGICFPKDTTSFTIKKKFFGTNFVYATSIEDFEEKSLTSHLVAYWDSSTGLLFLYFEGKYDREDGDDNSCPGKKCPKIIIDRNDGSMSAATCYTDAYGPYATDLVPPDDTALTPPDAADEIVTPEPSADLGAGPTKPFLIRSKPTA